MTVGFVAAACSISQLAEARDENRLRRLQSALARFKLLIIDAWG